MHIFFHTILTSFVTFSSGKVYYNQIWSYSHVYNADVISWYWSGHTFQWNFVNLIKSFTSYTSARQKWENYQCQFICLAFFFWFFRNIFISKLQFARSGASLSDVQKSSAPTKFLIWITLQCPHLDVMVQWMCVFFTFLTIMNVVMTPGCMITLI